MDPMPAVHFQTFFVYRTFCGIVEIGNFSGNAVFNPKIDREKLITTWMQNTFDNLLRDLISLAPRGASK